MPRPRKYDYKKDLPVTLFVTVPKDLKEQLDLMFTKNELNVKILKFLLDYVEKNRKSD